jgi:ABC-2 type transport system ATP-binding protein
MNAPAPIIHAHGLTRKFGDFTAVDQLTLSVAPGSIFAFLGANGSGKSTTIRMLIGLLRPTAGEIQVDGIDVNRNPRRVRDHIGYMGQKVSLYQGLSLRENVDFYAGLYGLAADELDRRWGALRERFALGEAESEKTEELPAGIRQRAGLALATLHQPRVLFLDEPTAGVDVYNRGLFWELIQEEAMAGVTVFVTTHFLDEVDYCDWVCFIDQGRLVADTTPEDLRRRYSEGYRVEVTSTGRDPAAARTALAPFGTVDTAAGGFCLHATTLDTALFTTIDRLRAGDDRLRIRIEPAAMTDVFRRVLRATEVAR